jgi:hypothetical protein
MEIIQKAAQLSNLLRGVRAVHGGQKHFFEVERREHLVLAVRLDRIQTEKSTGDQAGDRFLAKKGNSLLIWQ